MNRDKELYRELRSLSWHDLWTNEVPRFNAADPKARFQCVAVIRAVAVVFAESGPSAELSTVKNWLRTLLNDPEEKIRRYAIAALPKLARDDDDEKQLLALNKKSASAREQKHLASALGKIGGAETLRQSSSLPPETIQRIQATITRAEKPSAIKLDASFTKPQQIEILLHCRAGLEKILHDEVTVFIPSHKQFKHRATKTALVILTATAPFTLAQLLKLRCFDSFGFSLGATRDQTTLSIANLATSPLALQILKTFTQGPIRYRLDFAHEGHQRAAVRELSTCIYEKSPDLLNGGGDTPWTLEIRSANRANRLELVPKILPDPRFAYRRRDIPAASHPPLAACMARLAGPRQNEIVWDPFCGSGLELIERSLLGGVKKIIGTDLSPGALQIAEQNFTAANLAKIQTQFVTTDFRTFASGPVTLIITNPPLGRRVPIPNLPQLIQDLFEAAARHLVPNGQLIFVNPLNIVPKCEALKRDLSQLIDFGGFHCRLEKYTLRPGRLPSPR